MCERQKSANSRCYDGSINENERCLHFETDDKMNRYTQINDEEFQMQV